MVQLADFVEQTVKERLYYGKPRTYKYNMKSSHIRLAKLEKAQEKSQQTVTNRNKRETRILEYLITSLENGKEAFNKWIDNKQKRLITENRHRIITHKALQDSLKEGFIALNQFQNSGFRSKIVSDIEKQMSPNKAREKTIRRLSQKSFEESIKIGERNTMICRERFTQMTDKQGTIPARLLNIHETNSNITTPTNRQKDENKEHPKTHQRKQKQKMPKLVKRNSNIGTDSIVDDDDEDDKYYDEGGFTPRLRPHSLNEIYKSKLPSIPTGNSIFITTQANEAD